MDQAGHFSPKNGKMAQRWPFAWKNCPKPSQTLNSQCCCNLCLCLELPSTTKKSEQPVFISYFNGTHNVTEELLLNTKPEEKLTTSNSTSSLSQVTQEVMEVTTTGFLLKRNKVQLHYNVKNLACIFCFQTKILGMGFIVYLIHINNWEKDAVKIHNTCKKFENSNWKV